MRSSDVRILDQGKKTGSASAGMFDFDELEDIDPAVSDDQLEKSEPAKQIDGNAAVTGGDGGGSSMFDFDDFDDERPAPADRPQQTPPAKSTTARPSPTQRTTANGRAAAPAFGRAAAAPKATDAFQERVAELRERYPHIELDLPLDARTWSTVELENFFESAGFIKPVRPTPRPNGSAARPKPAVTPKVQGNFQLLPVPEALRLLEQLHTGFADKQFQESLKKLQAKYPQRKTRGHTDGPFFFESFERLTMTVYSKVLPKAGLRGDFDGVRELSGRMQTAMFTPKVKKAQEEINLLIGLPRDAVWKPASKKEELLAYCAAGDGDIPGFAVPLVMDTDGDMGHEFFIEDLPSGNMIRKGTATGGRLTSARSVPQRQPFTR